MKVEYSKAFTKAVKKLSGKILESVKEAIIEIKKAEDINQISDCEKLETYNNVYKKRIGNLRSFMTLHIKVEDKYIYFEYLVPRGQAYNKKIMNSLRKKDN